MGFVKDVISIPGQAVATVVRIAALVFYLLLGLTLCGLVWYMVYLGLKVV